MKKVFINLYKYIKKDITSILVLLVPVVLTVLIRITIPFFNFQNIYRIFDALIGLIVAICVSFIIVLYIIDDKRMNKRSLKELLLRLLVSMIVTFIYAILLILIFKISDISFKNILMIGLLNSFFSLPIIMMTIAFAKDRKSAIKVMSLTTIYIVVLAIPYVTWGLKQFCLSFVPSFWLGKYIYNFLNIYIFWGIGMSLIWSVIFRIKYIIKH